MTQPDYVPVRASDRVRPAERLPAARPWRPTRPADLDSPDMPRGPGLGNQGPDVGYGLKLARRFEDRLQLADGESREDVLVGGFVVGAKRASLFGRGPMIYDFELAYTLWGFLGGRPPVELVEFRRPLFQGAAHHYEVQRGVADRVPDETLRLKPADIAARISEWRQLIVTT